VNISTEDRVNGLSFVGLKNLCKMQPAKYYTIVKRRMFDVMTTVLNRIFPYKKKKKTSPKVEASAGTPSSDLPPWGWRAISAKSFSRTLITKNLILDFYQSSYL